MPRPGATDSTRLTGQARGRAALAACLAATLAGCHSTVDSLGYDDSTGLHLRKMQGPLSYPNAFRDVLGKTNAQIAEKIANAFNQLFHGDPSTQAIYFPVAGQDQAYIKDILHGDIRTDGMGLGMLIAAELGKQDEFDRLWSYARANMQVQSGPNKGYFLSSCATSINPGVTCFAPFGPQQMVMALLLANDLWGDPTSAAGVTPAAADGGTAAPSEYATAATELLTVMRHKVDQNGGVVSGVTDFLDPVTALVFAQPDASGANLTGPSIEMPGYYELWAQATGDPFWSRAARAARAYWGLVANPTTGLVPAGSHFDGAPSAGSDTFSSEAYRSLVNFVIDDIWAPGDPGAADSTAAAPAAPAAAPDRSWDAAEANLLLGFFIGADINQYGREFTLDGATVDAARDPALVAANGIAGLIATIGKGSDFIQAVWDMDIATGNARYFTGTMQMMGLLILGGQFRVY